MVTATVKVTEESWAKFIAMFPEGEALFQRVVADAVLDYDRKAAEASVPPSVRIEEATVEVSVDKEIEAAPMPEPEKTPDVEAVDVDIPTETKP